MVKRPFIIVAIVVFLAVLPTQGQERFSFFQASTPESVERLLQLAGLRDDDVVIDLGSGDGLIPLTAARMNARLRGRGVDINPKLVKESNERATREGLANRVTFEHRNAFDADLRDATVVTMWLFPELMRLLRPVILERARPGHAGPDQHVGARQLATRPRQQRWRTNLHVDCAGAGGRQLGLGSNAVRTTVPAGVSSRPAFSGSRRCRPCRRSARGP